MLMGLLAITRLAGQCAPAVAPETLVSIVSVESGFDPLAIGVNGSRPQRLHPHSAPEAVETAARLIAGGADIDLGLAQLNSRNLAPLGLSIADAFDPCRNLAASASILKAGYARANPQPGAEQAALRASLSLYNTGDEKRGILNGYVQRVETAAGRLIPRIKPDGVASPIPSTPTPSPTWDVFVRDRAPTSGFVFNLQSSGDGQ
jgi:type IV secretion system protein VirB1